jgi:hypothetical protein
MTLNKTSTEIRNDVCKCSEGTLSTWISSLKFSFRCSLFEIHNSVKIIFRKQDSLNSEAVLSPDLCELCIGSLCALEAITDLFNSVFTIVLIVQRLTP